METFWLLGRKDMGEANDSMVCMWKPKKRRVAATSSTNLSQISDTSSGLTSSNPSPKQGAIAAASAFATLQQTTTVAESCSGASAAAATAREKSSEGDKSVDNGSGTASIAVPALKSSECFDGNENKHVKCSESVSVSNGIGASESAEHKPMGLGTIPEDVSNSEVTLNTGKGSARSDQRAPDPEAFESALLSQTNELSKDAEDSERQPENATTKDGNTSLKALTQATVSTVPDLLNVSHGVEKAESYSNANACATDSKSTARDANKALNGSGTESKSNPRDAHLPTEVTPGCSLAEPVFTQTIPRLDCTSDRGVDTPGNGREDLGCKCPSDSLTPKVTESESYPDPWSQTLTYHVADSSFSSKAQPTSEQGHVARPADHTPRSAGRSLGDLLTEPPPYSSSGRTLAASPELKPSRISQVLHLAKSSKESGIHEGSMMSVSQSALDFPTLRVSEEREPFDGDRDIHHATGSADTFTPAKEASGTSNRTSLDRNHAHVTSSEYRCSGDAVSGLSTKAAPESCEIDSNRDLTPAASFDQSQMHSLPRTVETIVDIPEEKGK